MQDLFDVLYVFAPLWVPATIISGVLSLGVVLLYW